MESESLVQRPYDYGVGVRSRILGELARQAGHPGGLVGRLMGVALNVGDRKDVAAAVDTLAVPARNAPEPAGQRRC